MKNKTNLIALIGIMTILSTISFASTVSAAPGDSPTLVSQAVMGCTTNGGCLSQTIASVPVTQGQLVAIFVATNPATGSGALASCTFNGVACSVRAAYSEPIGYISTWEDYVVAPSTGTYPLVVTMTSATAWILTELTVNGENTVSPFDTGTTPNSNYYTNACNGGQPCSIYLGTNSPNDLIITGLSGGTYNTVPTGYTLATNAVIPSNIASAFATGIVSTTQSGDVTWPGVTGTYGMVIDAIQGVPGSTTSTSTSTSTSSTNTITISTSTSPSTSTSTSTSTQSISTVSSSTNTITISTSKTASTSISTTVVTVTSSASTSGQSSSENTTLSVGIVILVIIALVVSVYAISSSRSARGNSKKKGRS